LKPSLLWLKWNSDQSVRTRKSADAVRPLVSPVARTVWTPGTASAGMAFRDRNEPSASAVLPPKGA
jgi:hypothetical protein